ncbi:MAG: TIGR01777 family oxidoreductase [bacterium]|nr:TIGR01777 family oxidoreductase [bacterium]
MRVVITGGTGLIGKALTKSLATDGHHVVVVSRNPRQTEPLPATVSFQAWDGRTAEGWGKAVDGADAVVNLAGESIAGEGFLPARWTVERKHNILNSRVNAGKAVSDAVTAANSKPGVLIQASAVGYYGSQPNSKVITEASPAGNDFLADVCKQWEASTTYVESVGVRRAIIRTGVVLSLDGGALPRQAFPFKLFAGGPLGSGKQPYPWIHLADEVRAIRFLIEHPQATGPFNLTSPNPVTNAEFSHAIGRVMGRPSFVPAPGFAFKAAFGDVSMVVLEGQRAIPQRLQELGFTFLFPDAEGALRDLYKPERALATS